MTKIWKKLVVIWLIAVIVLPLMTGMQVWAKTEPKQLDILFTHDTHSHLNSFTTIVNGEKKEAGGFAKLKTLIDEHKKVNSDTLVLDGGDFSMGTLVQTVYDTEAAELRMLGQIGCDVTTLGNHEFDYQSKGLADMLNAAKNSGDTVPSLVLCNVDWDAMEEAGLSEGQKQIQSAFEKYQVKDYVVVQKGNIKIAVLGVFGKDALVCAPTCELVWKDSVKAAKQTVEKIKKKEKVDMIACVSHSGTWDEADKSEDEILAKEVPDIDLIISGHTHSQLDKPIQHGNTYIVSCGEYGKSLGTIGDFGCLSFHETKNLSMGEGGALFFQNNAYQEKAEILREKGTDRSKFFRGQIDKYTWQDYGSSYLPSDLNAAYLWAQLEMADDIQNDRMATWNFYNEALKPLADKELIEQPFIPKDCIHNAHMYYIKLPNLESRSDFIHYLRQHGVMSVFHYIPLHSAPAGKKYGRFFGEDRYTTKESERLVRLPMYYQLSQADKEYVVKTIFDYFNR